MAKVGYADIAAHFRQQIVDGVLRPGDSLPSQRDVINELNVSVTTANRAFRLLKSEGLTIAKPGVGTVVAPSTRKHVTGAGRLDRLARTSQPYAPGERSVLHQAGIRSINDPEVEELLELEARSEVVVRTRVFVQDDRPTVYATSVINMRALLVVPEVKDDAPLPKFWQLLYAERSGKTITKSPEHRGARLATPFELDRLGVTVPKGSAVPVLVLRNVFHDDQGPIEVWEDIYAPGIWQVAKE